LGGEERGSGVGRGMVEEEALLLLSGQRRQEFQQTLMKRG